MDVPARGQPEFDPWNKVPPVLDIINVTFKKPMIHQVRILRSIVYCIMTIIDIILAFVNVIAVHW